MIFSNLQENFEWTIDNFKIYDPDISKVNVRVVDCQKENYESDLDIKIWINKHK